jgi:hypothetical protein
MRQMHETNQQLAKALESVAAAGQKTEAAYGQLQGAVQALTRGSESADAKLVALAGAVSGLSPTFDALGKTLAAADDRLRASEDFGAAPMGAGRADRGPPAGGRGRGFPHARPARGGDPRAGTADGGSRAPAQHGRPRGAPPSRRARLGCRREADDPPGLGRGGGPVRGGCLPD